MNEMRERIVEAISEADKQDPWDLPNIASHVLRAMQIPTNRMVAAAADELGMDATKVAAVWMIMMRVACQDG